MNFKLDEKMLPTNSISKNLVLKKSVPILKFNLHTIKLFYIKYLSAIEKGNGLVTLMDLNF